MVCIGSSERAPTSVLSARTAGWALVSTFPTEHAGLPGVHSTVIGPLGRAAHGRRAGPADTNAEERRRAGGDRAPNPPRAGALPYSLGTHARVALCGEVDFYPRSYASHSSTDDYGARSAILCDDLAAI